VATERTELQIVILVAAVQFVNILDFMMVMPLGPDFAESLGIATSRLGLLGGAYTGAAAVSGIAASSFLDRFDRRSALATAVLGLSAATFLGALAWNFETLLMARVIAGAFGGPATAVALSIIADVVPIERRGRAMATVMGAFAVASVLGVPAGLELARLAGWRAPFIGVGSLTLGVMIGVWFLMPSMRSHIGAGPGDKLLKGWLNILKRPVALLMMLTFGTAMFANFAIIPNLATYLQYNLGYPRAQLGILYLVGGTLSFGVMQLVGRLVDRFGAPLMAAIGCALLLGVFSAMFFDVGFQLPVVLIFSMFMVASAFRGVPMNTIATRVPRPHERARYMSAQSAVQHTGSALGATISSFFLVEASDHSLIGMQQVATLSMILVALVPFMIYAIDRMLRAEDSRIVPDARAPA
jgi:predicted MFS family arabinose efflux permease